MTDKLDEIREERSQKVAGIFKYFSLIMGTFYLLIGLAFYFFPIIPDMDAWAKIGASSLLILYGIFRLWRALKS